MICISIIYIIVLLNMFHWLVEDQTNKIYIIFAMLTFFKSIALNACCSISASYRLT